MTIETAHETTIDLAPLVALRVEADAMRALIEAGENVPADDYHDLDRRGGEVLDRIQQIVAALMPSNERDAWFHDIDNGLNALAWSISGIGKLGDAWDDAIGEADLVRMAWQTVQDRRAAGATEHELLTLIDDLEADDDLPAITVQDLRDWLRGLGS